MARRGECENCHRERSIAARNLCTTCYREKFLPVAECASCGRIRKLRSRANCGSCLEKERLEKDAEKKTARQQYLKNYRKREGFKEAEKRRRAKRDKDPEYLKKKKRRSFLYRLRSYGITEDFYNEECR